jgi:hypothetical protein
MAADGKDIYQRFELAVRTPKTRALIDAFLPSPDTLESSVAPEAPPPLPVPEMTVEEAYMFRRRGPDADEEPPPAAKPRAKKKAVPKKKETETKSLQDEIAEFMNRDRPALAPDDDLASLVDHALDPNTEPDKKN